MSIINCKCGHPLGEHYTHQGYKRKFDKCFYAYNCGCKEFKEHMDSNLKVGDKVRLNSGGPVMTVTKIKTGDRPLYHAVGAPLSALCTWFDDNEVRGEWFPVEALRG